jgi:hypothetical protein
MRLASVSLVFVGLWIGACGGAKEAAKMPASDSLPTALEHEPCDAAASGAQRVDTNGDGKPDIVSVMSGAHETCRVVDLNHDDKPDSFIYFDGGNNIRRRESDYDRDGKIDEIAYFTAASSTPGTSTKGARSTTACAIRTATAGSTSGGRGPTPIASSARSSPPITTAMVARIRTTSSTPAL